MISEELFLKSTIARHFLVFLEFSHNFKGKTMEGSELRTAE